MNYTCLNSRLGMRSESGVFAIMFQRPLFVGYIASYLCSLVNNLIYSLYSSSFSQHCNVHGMGSRSALGAGASLFLLS